MKYEKIKVDQKVVYIPKHCRSGLSREGWEEGIVVHKDEEGDKKGVFVRYWNPKTSTYEGGLKFTSCEDLVNGNSIWIKSFPKKEGVLMPGDLEVGYYYVPYCNDKAIFRYAIDKKNCIYVHRVYKSYSRSSFGGDSNLGYRTATLEEILLLNECIQNNSYVEPPLFSDSKLPVIGKIYTEEY